MTAMLRGRIRRENRAVAADATLLPPAHAKRTSGSRITNIAGSDETGDGQRAPPCGIVTQADPVYKSVRRPDTRWPATAQQKPPQTDIRIDVASYPDLDLLCWNLATPHVIRRDAFAIHERNWRWIDAANTHHHERALIDTPAAEFGDGLINA